MDMDVDVVYCNFGITHLMVCRYVIVCDKWDVNEFGRLPIHNLHVVVHHVMLRLILIFVA